MNSAAAALSRPISDNVTSPWTPMPEEVKTSLNTKGALMVCLDNETFFLRERAQPTDIDGPSYDCSKASSTTELAMCADKGLWAKDRAMNAIYFYIRKYDNVQVRKTLLANQREWLRKRNGCGGDRQCLNRVYDERLQVFKDIDVSS